jgi:aminodeoxychorismate synthase component I
MPARLSLSKKEFIQAAHKGPVPALALDIPYSSPASVYPSVGGPGSFLLESVKGPHRIARYSFAGFAPFGELTVKDGVSRLRLGGRETLFREHPLATLTRLLHLHRQRPDPALPPFQGGLAGMLGYDFVHYLEDVPATTEDDLRVPDAHFLLVDRLLAWDHRSKRAWAVMAPGARGPQDDASLWYDEAEETLHRVRETLRPAPVEPLHRAARETAIRHDTSRERYLAMVRRTIEYIRAGDIFQANLSLRVSAEVGDQSPWNLYLVLRQINPSPFAAFMDMGGYQVVSSSPERLLKVHGDLVETRPIAGTRPRGKNRREDTAMRAELLLNEKERAEHIMLIDLERNDLGRVCRYATVEVDELMTTEEYSHVIHIVSNVRGRLREATPLPEAIRAAFPGGTITGVPKVRCMEIIDELEAFRRGPYTGSLGYLGFSGSMDLNIIIRTFTIKDGMAYVQAGAGIVADSDPEREYVESLNKAEALIKTLKRAGREAVEVEMPYNR